MNPEYKETIGVNEVIRKPPIVENANDPDSMIRLEGQAMGRLGDRRRSWIMIILMWMAFGGPIMLVILFELIFGKVTMPLLYHIGAIIFIGFITALIHIPVCKAIYAKIHG